MTLHQVLFVNTADSPMDMAIWQKRLVAYDSQFGTVFVDDADEIVNILKNNPISVVVTNFIMPSINGLDLLAYIDRYYPHIRCLVLTPPESREQKVNPDDKETIEYFYFEKTLDFQKFAGKILDMISSIDAVSSFAKISVASLLQLVEIEDKTCHLKVKRDNTEKGSFYFIRGNLWNAVYDNVEGEEAALTMIGWEQVDFKFDKLPRNDISRTINKELMYLLMEGKRRKDEQDEINEEALAAENPENHETADSSPDSTGELFSTQMEEMLDDSFLDDDNDSDPIALYSENPPDVSFNSDDACNETEQKLQSLFEDDDFDSIEETIEIQENPPVDQDIEDISENHEELSIKPEIPQVRVETENSDQDHSEEDKQLLESIMLVEGHHFQKARAALVACLKKSPQNYKAWLWYSRVSDNLKAVESALKNAAIFAPGDVEVSADIQKLVLAKNTLKNGAVRHCPFCYAPVDTFCVLCHYCQSHFRINDSFFVSARKAQQEIMDKAVKRYHRVSKREQNSTADFYLAMAQLNLENWEEGLEQIIKACIASGGKEFYVDQQKKLMRFMASIETRPESEVYTRKKIIADETVSKKGAAEKTVLVVEDSTVSRKVITMALSGQGYVVSETKDGMEALAYIEKQRPDLVLLDITMPGMDGYQVLTAMRQKQWMKEVPVIMLTARGKLIDKLKGKMAGSSEYLTKPFEPEMLIQTVEKYFS